jgi:hypothetical protein
MTTLTWLGVALLALIVGLLIGGRLTQRRYRRRLLGH